MDERIRSLEINNHRLEVLLTEYRSQAARHVQLAAENLVLKEKLQKSKRRIRLLKASLELRDRTLKNICKITTTRKES